MSRVEHETFEISYEEKNTADKVKKATSEIDDSQDIEEKHSFIDLKKLMLVLKKKWFLIILMTVIFMMFLSSVSYMFNSRESKATMMLNYEKSADGLAPNGTRFNISDFKSETVLEMIIKNAGLEGKVTTDEMRESITLSAISVKKPTGRSSSFYIPTSYRITYTKSKNVKGISTDNMLDVICNTYVQYFYDNYTVNSQILTEDYSGLDGMEYAQIGAYLNLRVSDISEFLSMRIDEAGSFKSDKSGETFSSIKKMLDNIKDYDLENYSAYIWEKGIVQDEKVYVDTRQYLINKNTRSETFNFNEYNIRKETIEYYNDIMSTSILIPTLNKKNFYMARTKTGVDYLATEAKWYLESSKQLHKEILTDEDKISKCQAKTESDEYRKADLMVDNMVSSIVKIEKLASEINKEYKSEYVKSYLTFTNNNDNIWNKISKRKVLMASLVFMLAVVYIYYKNPAYTTRSGKAK